MIREYELLEPMHVSILSSRSSGRCETFPYDPKGRGVSGFAALDSRRMREELGWTARIGLSDGLSATVAWHLDNETWWRNVISGKYKEWVVRQYGGEAGA